MAKSRDNRPINKRADTQFRLGSRGRKPDGVRRSNQRTISRRESLDLTLNIYLPKLDVHFMSIRLWSPGRYRCMVAPWS